MSVIAFHKPENSGPHMSGEAVCSGCGHSHVAVAPVGVWLFECPECHTHKARMKYSCMPASGHIWQCVCGCDIFRITSKAALCINCGHQQLF